MGRAQAHVWAVQQTSAEGPTGGTVWAVQFGQGHWVHLQCAGYTTAWALKVLREKREFQCKCKKAQV